MNYRNLFWWLGFILCGIWGQSFIPGVDLLMVGLLISLQEERLSQTLWLLGACILIQEGTGSLAFGSGILWYSALIAMFFLGRWLFQARNLFFVIIMGGVMGAWRYLLVVLLATLQNYQVTHERLFFECVLQALLFPLIWTLVSPLRFSRDNDAISA